MLQIVKLKEFDGTSLIEAAITEPTVNQYMSIALIVKFLNIQRNGFIPEINITHNNKISQETLIKELLVPYKSLKEIYNLVSTYDCKTVEATIKYKGKIYILYGAYDESAYILSIDANVMEAMFFAYDFAKSSNTFLKL